METIINKTKEITENIVEKSQEKIGNITDMAEGKIKNVLPNKTEFTESPLLSGFVGLLALGFLYFT